MVLHTNLFLGKGIKHPRRIVNKLNSGKLPKKFYIIAFTNGGKRLEIMVSFLFIQKAVRAQNYEIVGIVKSEEDAFEYIRRLSELSVSKYGDFDARTVIDEMTGRELRALSIPAEVEE